MMTSLRQPMVQYLKVAEAPNLKETCGILKWFVTLKATASSDQTQPILNQPMHII
jgi:hypothetical protein